MSDPKTEEFLSRVMEKMSGMSRDHFSAESWSYENRPTNEGVGLKPGVDIDVETVAARILDVQSYPGNVKYVESTEVTNPISDSEFVYIQKMKLPALGGVQVSMHMEDLGERDGYRVIAWDQDDEGTMALDKKDGGARTEYNLGAWLIKPTELAYALAAAPVKKDVGTLKYAVMTKGADATASTVMSANIDGMIEWSQRD